MLESPGITFSNKEKEKLKNWIKRELNDYKVLLRSIPSPIVMFFVLSIVCMNLLANKLLVDPEITGKFFGGFTLDCGYTLSWIAFLCMDMICKRFGPKAATKLSIFAIVVNLGATIVFWLLMKTPGLWWVSYDAGDALETVNGAVSSVFAGTWQIVIGSATAMLISSIVNALLNWKIGIASHDDNSYKKFALRSFVSTGIAQFVDNFVFCFLLGLILYTNVEGYFSASNLIINPIIGMLIELFCEIVFSPIGYRMSKKWATENVGNDYIALQQQAKA